MTNIISKRRGLLITLTAFISIVSGQKLWANCEQTDAEFLATLTTLPETVEEFAPYNSRQRVLIFQEMSPEQKAVIMQDQLAAELRRPENRTSKRMKLISSVMAQISSDLYQPTTSRANIEALRTQFESLIVAEFTQPEAVQIFATIGEPYAADDPLVAGVAVTSGPPTAQPACSCVTDSWWSCGDHPLHCMIPIHACKESSWGCGFLGLWGCNGRCYNLNHNYPYHDL